MTSKRKTTDDASGPPKKAKLDVSPTPERRSPRNKVKSTVAPANLSKEPSNEPSNSSMEQDNPDTMQTNSKTKKKSYNAAGDTLTEWELLDGASRNPFQVGVPEPQRLVVRFRNKLSGKVDTCKRAEDEIIDWNNAAEIYVLNRWRRQLFTRRGFPNLVTKLPWIPQETAYLELMYEKLREKVHSDASIQLPNQKKVFEAFNEFFEDRTDLTDEQGQLVPQRGHRNDTSLDSYVRRKKNPVSVVRKEILDKMKSMGDDAWLPDITNEEIEARVNNKARVPTAPALLKRKGNDVTKPKAKGLPVAKTSKSGNKSKTNTTKDIGGAAVPELSTTPRMSEPPFTTGQPPSKSAPAAETTPPAQSNHVKESLKKGTKKQAYTEQSITTNNEFAKLRAEGWNCPTLPESDDEAFRLHSESMEDVAFGADWPISPEQALDERLKRNPVKFSKRGDRAGHRGEWYRDCKSKGQYVKDEDGDEVEIVAPERFETAATTNAVLGYATIPPFGFRGDTHKLREDPRMPETELILTRLSREAQQVLHDAHETAFDERSEKDQVVVYVREEQSSEDEDEEAL
jgi:hypothetical protein